MKKKFPLHLKILVGMLLGVMFGIVMMNVGKADQAIVEEANSYSVLVKDAKLQKEKVVERITKINEFFSRGVGGESDVLEKETLEQNLINLDAEIVLLQKKTRIPNSWGKDLVMNWVKPWGTIFVNLLKLIAIPLIVASLLKGISDLKDISKFKKIGGRSILIYIGTTVIAIAIGLLIVNLVSPGDGVSQETIAKMTETYAGNSNIEGKLSTAASQVAGGPLDFLVDMVPSNLFQALSHNGSMLKVIFFVIFLGISMLLVPEKQVKPIKDFFDGLNEVVLKMVDLIMLGAPFAVFALLATVIVSSESWVIIQALLWYAGTVIVGLLLMIVFYLLLVGLVVKKNPFWFLKQLAPAQLLAFTTSSSAATLPVTIERVEEHLGVDKEVSSFVLPVGATINMDGTSLYQAVAAVFIAQALGVI